SVGFPFEAAVIAGVAVGVAAVCRSSAGADEPGPGAAHLAPPYRRGEMCARADEWRLHVSFSKQGGSDCGTFSPLLA
ncbi:hypothetical protein, partial [Sphingomonas koreensis]|uniref:hypothetical protein n=1 Tax=Sphingomonas koreensis TaxID=93064 RepID=UPI0019D12CBC